MQLSKNFQLSEFACPCCGQMPNPDDPQFQKLIAKLQSIRDACRFPLKINSGYRCKKQNKKVGGVADSSHLTGLAVDIEIKTDFQRLVFLEMAFQKFKRIGIAKTYIHVDIDDSKENACWVY